MTEWKWHPEYEVTTKNGLIIYRSWIHSDGKKSIGMYSKRTFDKAGNQTSYIETSARVRNPYEEAYKRWYEQQKTTRTKPP